MGRAPRRNLLDLHPRAVHATERLADGRLIVLEPKFPSGLLGKLVQPRLTHPWVKVDLDEVGTVVWECCDGETPVRAIAERLAERFGDEFDPDHARLGLFVRSLESRGWIRYREDD